VCGIVGVYGRSSAGRIDDLLAATNLLAHRGPDGSGYWHEPPFGFGHRRLSIIDLSLGAQPMADASGRYVITFNGEIYNYVELRAELEARGSRFATHSDTEVILEAYRQYGVGAAAKLVGMFAFAIADRLERSLYLARDRLGEKPLYIWTAPSGDIAFASELKAITCMSGFAPKINPVALAGYMLLNSTPGNATLLGGVAKLPPGAWTRLHLDRPRETGAYWTPASRETIADDTAIRGPESLDELSKRLDHAVHIALRSDVPVTLFLSGGIDSSLVAESASRQGYLRHAYCLDFHDRRFSEWDNAKLVADRLGIELRRAVAHPVSPQDFDRLVYHADDPLADSSAVAVDALAREVAKDYKVAISGDGGDEIFGGYLTYKATALYGWLRSIVPAKGARLVSDWLAGLHTADTKVSLSYKAHRFLRAWGHPPAFAHFTWNGSWLPGQAAGLLAPDLAQARPVERAVEQLVAGAQLPASPSLRDLQMADMREYLPHDILTKVDRMTMAHGLEARAPLLDPGVVEFGLTLDARSKLRFPGKGKLALRALAARTLPKSVTAAKKQGFSIPVHAWLRGEMRESLETFLSRERVSQMGFLDTDAVMTRKHEHLSGKADLGFELWGLMALSACWGHHSRCSAVTIERETASRRIEFAPVGQSSDLVRG
jgi:asparagine synthase (glutamine-hydrolysing)